MMILPIQSITPAAPTKPPTLGGVDARPEEISMHFHSIWRTDDR
jgi:hypothetical protein